MPIIKPVIPVRRPSKITRGEMPAPRSRPMRDRAISDYGIDNFSYDKDHLEQWKIPGHLLEKLPAELQAPAREWQYAAAALCTGLDRIAKLDDESLYRGYPEAEMSSHPHLSRRVSNAQTAAGLMGVGNDTPPMSSPESSAPASFTGGGSSMLSFDKMSSSGAYPARQVVGMESPPFTPVDSQTFPTPEYNPRGIPIKNSTMPDVHALTRQLSPISLRGRGDSTTSSQCSNAQFDESAWDVYINNFKAELYDIQTLGLNRIKGLNLQIDKLSLEYGCESRFKAPIEEFNAWWAENKGRTGKWEKKVRELELPDIEYIRKERRSMGWSV